jgi:hypothetical protein
MTRYAWIIGFLIAISSHGALACQGSSVILDEKFTAPESGWDKPDQMLIYGSSGAVFKPPQGQGYIGMNSHFTSDGTDLCTTAIWPASGVKPTELDGTVGIMFWAKDYQNYYVAKIGNQGNFYITRYITNVGQDILRGPQGDNVHLEFVNKDPGGKNELEVQISGTKATFFVNGKKVVDFAGQPPPASGYVGIYASNFSDGHGGGTTLTYTFSNFRIAAYP